MTTTEKFYIVNEERAQDNYGDWYTRQRVFLDERDAVMDCFRRNFDRWWGNIRLCGFSLWPNEARFRQALGEDAREMVDVIANAAESDLALTFDLERLDMDHAQEINKYFIACLHNENGGYRYYTVEQEEFEPSRHSKRAKTG